MPKLKLRYQHRLLCGDSTVKENVDRLMNGQKADMVYCDPPYGMNLDTDYTKMGDTAIKHRSVVGDNKQFVGKFILDWFDCCGEIFLWGADYYIETLERTHSNLGSWVVWDKRSSDSDIGLMDGQFGSAFELCWSKSKHKREIARFTKRTCDYRGDESSVHPTQKPVQLHEWFFNKWGKDKTNIVDLFLGSGSTLIACEKTKRKCYGMEIDPHYCDVIIKRWQQYTDQDAILESEGKTFNGILGLTNERGCI